MISSIDPPMPQGHSGYWKDPRVWELVNKAAGGPGIPGPTASHPGIPDAGAVDGLPGAQHGIPPAA